MGVKKGYVGIVVENLVDELGILLVDFTNPYKNEDICLQAEIKSEDCRWLGTSRKDREIASQFRALFKN